MTNRNSQPSSLLLTESPLYVTGNGFTKTKFFIIAYDVLNEHTPSKPTETLGSDPCGQNARPPYKNARPL